MNIRKKFPFIIAGLAFVAACSGSYEFRSDDRPTFDRSVTPAELTAMQLQGARVLDVRLIEDFRADPVLVPDAMYQNPEDIQSWTARMSPDDGPVVVYCVAGKWVSQKAASYLQDRGFEVYSLEGGIAGWKASGMRTSGTSN